MNITDAICFIVDTVNKLSDQHLSDNWQISEYERENKQLRELVKQYVDNDLQNISHEMGVNENDKNSKHP